MVVVSVKWLAVKTASEMTYIVSSGALNSTPTNQQHVTVCDLPSPSVSNCHEMCATVHVHIIKHKIKQYKIQHLHKKPRINMEYWKNRPPKLTVPRDPAHWLAASSSRLSCCWFVLLPLPFAAPSHEVFLPTLLCVLPNELEPSIPT